MALPPKGDPRRPLHLAARSMRVLAILFFVICALSAIVSLSAGRRSAILMTEAVVVVFYGLPGVANLVLAIYAKRRHRWAVIAAIVVTSIELLFMLLLAVFVLMVGLNGRPHVAGAVIAFVIMLALGQLLTHLIQSLLALDRMQFEDRRGFEVLGVQPMHMQPPPPAQQSSTPADIGH